VNILREIRCGNVVYQSYDEYIKSKHWRQKKEEYKKHFKYQCTMCEEKKELHLHHITYERIGNERLDDLVYLCKTCHGKIHEALKPNETLSLGFLKNKRKKLGRTRADCRNCGHFKVSNNGDKICKFYGILNPNEKWCERFHIKSEVELIPNGEPKQKPKIKKGNFYNRLNSEFTTYDEISKLVKKSIDEKLLLNIYKNKPNKSMFIMESRLIITVEKINPCIKLFIGNGIKKIANYKLDRKEK
jgi:hypothetical protein